MLNVKNFGTSLHCEENLASSTAPENLSLENQTLPAFPQNMENASSFMKHEDPGLNPDRVKQEVDHYSLFCAAFQGNIAKKGERQSYYCDLCLVELNSDDTMKAHKDGQKHLKKRKAYENQAIEEGKLIDETACYIRPIAPQKLAPKKIPIRLREKLRETKEAVVGLEFVTEVISYSDIEMEPHYECRLCPNQGQANHMFNHLLGRGHREKYFENKYDIQPENTGPYQIQKMAESEQENEKTELITTIYSDELYPWLSGKAPWSLEQGGTGIPPTNARTGDGVSLKSEIEDPVSQDSNSAQTTFHVRGLPPLTDAYSVKARYDAMRKILDQTYNYHHRCVDEVTKKDIRDLHDFLLSNIEMMKGVKLEDDMYLNAPNSKERCYKKDYSRSPSPKRYSLGKQNFSEDEDNYYTLKCNYCPNHSVFTCHSRNDLERHEAKVHGYSPHRVRFQKEDMLQ